MEKSNDLLLQCINNTGTLQHPTIPIIYQNYALIDWKKFTATVALSSICTFHSIQSNAIEN